MVPLIERDPEGLSQHVPGSKLDSGKIRVHLLKGFGLALLAVAELATKGADKYSDHGWAKVKDGISRYDDAALGHIFREIFEDADPETQVHHAVATAWNVIARLQLMIEADPEWKARLMQRMLP